MPPVYSSDSYFLVRMPDGTIKQVNPFSGTQVWTVPGRGNRPMVPDTDEHTINPVDVEEYCAFCPSEYLNTPPEKARVIKEDGQYKTLYNVPAKELFDTKVRFRRMANLFEIISFDYWAQNYSYMLDQKAQERKDRYLSTDEGRDHVINMINFKLTNMGMDEKKIAQMGFDEKINLSNSFFAGGHDLIIGRRHYTKNATTSSDKASSGELTVNQHEQYIRFTIDSLRDIYVGNRYVRYVTVFQNWLKPAGASFDHLHKQLVAIDGRSAATEREISVARNNPNAYNDYGTNYAGYNNLVFAENEHAIAFADFGHRFPTLAVYSKARRNQPWNLKPEQIKDMSDLVHACHAAMGSQIPCNEEWYYRPPDVDVSIPWHILIKWRVSNPAGFEAVTKIYVNTIDPWTLRDRVVDKLYKLRDEGKIANMKLATECDCVPNCLMYNPFLRLRHKTRTDAPAEGGRGRTLSF